MDRRTFLMAGLGSLVAVLPSTKNIMTVNGPIRPGQMGYTLVHEHMLVDFIGADQTGYHRWNREAVIRKVLPYLLEAKKAGVRTVFDCTPAFLGRDPLLLKQLSVQSGLHLITNTGYYGAVNNKYLPSWAYTESVSQLAERWYQEAKYGIEHSGIKPGFIKISIEVQDPLSELHRKLVLAAALTHLATGLTICSHTGQASGAFQQLDLLKSLGVHPSAFVWVHAQAEKDPAHYLRAARMGAWISLDGMGWGKPDEYVEKLVFLKENALLHRVLVSHDAGWYKPDEPDASFQGFTPIFTELLPRLKTKGFSTKDVHLLLVKNPAAALQIKLRKL